MVYGDVNNTSPYHYVFCYNQVLKYCCQFTIYVLQNCWNKHCSNILGCAIIFQEMHGLHSCGKVFTALKSHINSPNNFSYFKGPYSLKTAKDPKHTKTLTKPTIGSKWLGLKKDESQLCHIQNKRLCLHVCVLCIFIINTHTYIILPKVLGHPLLIKYLNTLLISMSTNLNV